MSLSVGHKLNRAFILFRQDDPGDYEGVPVAVYVGDDETCRADMEHRQSVNPGSRYYVLDKPLNPKSSGFPLSLTEEGVRAVLHAMRKTYPDAQEDSVAGRSIAMLEATAEAQAQVVADRVRALAGREERDG